MASAEIDITQATNDTDSVVISISDETIEYIELERVSYQVQYLQPQEVKVNLTDSTRVDTTWLLGRVPYEYYYSWPYHVKYNEGKMIIVFPW